MWADLIDGCGKHGSFLLLGRFLTKYFPHNNFTSSPEMPVSYIIYEAVGSAAKIDQEPVYRVNLSRQSGYPVLSVNVIDDADWKPGKRKTNHYRPLSLSNSRQFFYFSS